MYTIGTSCRRRGTSTIYGVMIFVGIMFTAVIPMILVMNQADTLYEIRKVELRRLDEEHAMESIFFHLETSIETGTGEPIITLIFYNRCEIAVRIIHVWINGELREIDLLISPTSNGEWEIRNLIDPVDPVYSFSIMVVTDKGNIFLPPSGTPTYNPELGGRWDHDVYTIYIMMTHKRSQLHILVINTHDRDHVLLDPPVTYFDDSVKNNLDGYWIGVPRAGDYLIVVTHMHKTPPLFDDMRTVNEDNPMALVIV